MNVDRRIRMWDNWRIVRPQSSRKEATTTTFMWKPTDKEYVNGLDRLHKNARRRS